MSRQQLTPRQVQSLRRLPVGQRATMRAAYLGQNANRAVMTPAPRVQLTSATLSPMRTGMTPQRGRRATPVIPPLFNSGLRPEVMEKRHFVTAAYTQPLTTRTQSLFLRIAPTNLGMGPSAQLYTRYLIPLLEYRFVGQMSDNQSGNHFVGYTASMRDINNVPNSVMVLNGAFTGRSNATSPWVTAIDGRNRPMDYLINSSAGAASNANSQGYIHLVLTGATAATSTVAGSAHGYLEIRYTVGFRDPIG